LNRKKAYDFLNENIKQYGSSKKIRQKMEFVSPLFPENSKKQHLSITD